MNALLSLDDNHIYRIGDIEVPSVTQLLVKYGHVNTTFIKPGYAARGVMVHKVAEMIDEGLLSAEDVTFFDDPLIAGFLAAYQKFLVEQNPTILAIESRRVYGTIVAGTIDRIVMLPTWEHPIILDIKTTAKKQASHAIQTAGYAFLAVHGEGEGAPLKGSWENVPRIGLYLKPDGTYKLSPYGTKGLREWALIMRTEIANDR